MIINLCGAASSLLILSRVWRHVEWRRYFGLAAPALTGVVPGAWLASHVPEAPLEICIGVLLILGLLASQRLNRSSWRASGPAPMVALGFSSGLMNAAAGVGGPAITAYAIVTRWEQRGFGATLQPYFITTGLSCAAVQIPVLWRPPSGPGGLAVAGHPRRHDPSASSPVTCSPAGWQPGFVRKIVVVIAYAGAVSTVSKGVLELALG